MALKFFNVRKLCCGLYDLKVEIAVSIPSRLNLDTSVAPNVCLHYVIFPYGHVSTLTFHHNNFLFYFAFCTVQIKTLYLVHI